MTRTRTSLLAVAAILCLATATVAHAQAADQRTTELLTALQAGNFSSAEAHFDDRMQAGLPPEKLQSVWEQLTSHNGALKSFDITGRFSTGGEDVRIATLHFEHSGELFAQVAVNSAGMVSGLFFRPATAEKASPEADRLADERVNQMLEAIRDGKFDAAEDHFDATMKSALPPATLQSTWTQQTSALGALTAWRIVGRSAVDGITMRIVNLDFGSKPKAFALRLGLDPSGAIAGLYFVEPLAEPVSSIAPQQRRFIQG
jgi:hypothetical protein